MIRMLRLGMLLLCLTVAAAAQNSKIFLKIDPYGDQTNPVIVEPGKTYTFIVKAYEIKDPTVPPVEVPISGVNWSLSPATFGTLSQTGVLQISSILPGSMKSIGEVRATVATATGMTLTAASVLLLDQLPPQYDYTINGVVKDEAGNAIPNAAVAAQPYSSPISAIFSERTDQDGKYTIKVPAGKYIMTAQAQKFVLEYYDNVFSPDKATPVEVGAAAKNANNIDFILGTGGAITGQVTARDGGTPLAGALIYAFPVSTNPSTGSPSAKAITDTKGIYQVDGLTPGSYFVFVSMQGFTSLYYDGALDLKSAKPVSVANGLLTGSIDFALEKGSIDPNVNPYTISGIVTDVSRTPVPGADVIAQMDPQPNGAVRSFAAKSGQDGTYKISVPGGIFTVRASAQGYMPEYFDNAKTLDKATKLTLTATNKSADNVNFTLAEGGRITGRVIRASDSTPVVDAQVIVLADPSKPPTNSGKGGTRTDAQGGYTVTGLPTDSYIVMVMKDGFDTQYYKLQSDMTLATRVDVNEGLTVPGIDFVLSQTAGISGKVIDQDNNAPIAKALVMVSAGSNARSFSAYTDQNGDFSLSLPAGTYAQVFASAPQYATEWYNEKSSAASADPVTVTTGAVLMNVNFTLERYSGIIAGTVRDESGTPLPKITVKAWAPATNGFPNPGTATGSSYAAESGADGTYEIRGLAPGNYTVSAFGPGYLIEYFDNSPTPAGAKPVLVLNKQTTGGVDFSLGRGGNISGVVADAKSQQPVPYALVTVHDAATSADITVRSDANGLYVLGGLSAGDYAVFASAKGYKTQFYNNAPDASSAIRVHVTPPNTTTGIDFALEPAPVIKSALSSGLADALTQLPASSAIEASLDPTMERTANKSADIPGGHAATGSHPLPVFDLKQNYPNPFNPSTTIGYSIPAAGKVTLKIYNLLGEEIATLVSGAKMAGAYTAVWNADAVPSGIYIYRLETNGSVMTRKMTLLK